MARKNKNIWVVPVPLSIIKRIEGIFVANDCIYFTDEGKDHTRSAVYKIRNEINGTRLLLHFVDFWGWVQKNNLEAAIETELEPELTALNTTLWDWLNDNKVRRSEIIERV